MKPLIKLYLLIAGLVVFVLIVLWSLRPRDYNCSDFKSRAALERVYTREDKYDLDRDKDGRPCESIK